MTGYGGWANHDVNPSALLAETVTGLKVGAGAYRIVTDVLPVDWIEGPAKLISLIKQYKPKAIVCLGLAGGSTGMRVERVAVNLSNGADNAELKREDGPLDESGPDALFATLPTRNMVKAIVDAGVPAALSMSAGTYLCNAAMYTAIRHGGGVPAGFIHVRFAIITRRTACTCVLDRSMRPNLLLRVRLAGLQSSDPQHSGACRGRSSCDRVRRSAIEHVARRPQLRACCSAGGRCERAAPDRGCGVKPRQSGGLRREALIST